MSQIHFSRAMKGPKIIFMEIVHRGSLLLRILLEGAVFQTLVGVFNQEKVLVGKSSRTFVCSSIVLPHSPQHQHLITAGSSHAES